MYKYFGIVVLAFLFLGCQQNNKNNSGDEKLSLDQLIHKYPDSIPLLNKRAERASNDFNYNQALKDAAHSFRLDSNNYQSRLLYAEALLNKKDIANFDISISEYHYTKVLEHDKKNLKALVGLANILTIRGDNEHAFSLINRALRIDPKYRDAYVLKGSIYRNQGNLKLAKSSYETAIQQDPEFCGGYLMLGSLYQYEENPICIEYYTTACKLKPKDVDMLYSLAYAKHQFGNSKDAKRIYRKMINMDSSYYEAFFQLGYIKQFDEIELDSAMHFYSLSLDIEPKHIESLHNLGLIYEEKKDVGNALLTYAKVLKINPEFELTLERVNKLKKLR